MARSKLKSLIAKLNPTCRSVLESAAGLCLAHTHYDVDLEHFLLKLLDLSGTDCEKILRYFEINDSHLIGDLSAAIDQFKTGNARTPALSPHIKHMIEAAWLLASIDFQVQHIRSGHILLALLEQEDTAALLTASSPLFKKISVETLRSDFEALTEGSVEAETGESPASDSAPAGGAAPAGRGQSLAQYTINLTERAQRGEIDPVIGRDFEIRQMIDILIRRRQNNPILTGEAGVGKTAVVEGFALRIVEGDVPPPLRNVALHTLDLGLLQAGAGIKGEFEDRLKKVIEEVKASPVPIILFIDEAHTLIGAGGQAGQNDAANLLKPALARGELRTIAATTWAEYKRYFEKDAALARRFQVVKIEEPDERKALGMMRAMAPFLEKHHQVMITDEALLNSVRLSRRYLPARQLPDKSVSVLDTACARIAIGLSSSPPALEEAQRQLAEIEREARILSKEALMGREHRQRLTEIDGERTAVQKRIEELEARWNLELELANRIIAVRQELADLNAGDPHDPSIEGKAAELREMEAELSQFQGEAPLVQVAVEAQTISEVISGWTGIPTGRMMADEIQTVLNLEQLLGERIIGQEYALAAIAQMVQTAHAGMEDPTKPTGVFLFVGTSGVGKTETALAISDLLYGGEQNVISINMSEYQEAHTVSGLKGSPPGYVGYGEGGVLTEAVRKRPYSVVLLDEVEKAHPDVMELFYQVFDKGILEDGEGRKIDFKNTLIVLTTNLGTDTIMKVCADEETKPTPEGLAELLRPELTSHFKPAFLGRLKVVPFFPITDNNLRVIVRLKLNKIAKRMQENRRIRFLYDDEVVEAIGNRCTEVDSGARNIDHILTNTLLPEISRELLARMIGGEQIDQIKVSLDTQGQFAYTIEKKE